MTAETKNEDCIYGSAILPSVLTVSWTAFDGQKRRQELALGTVVALAHESSGMTAEEWNRIEDNDREERINAALGTMIAAHVAADECVAGEIEARRGTGGAR